MENRFRIMGAVVSGGAFGALARAGVASALEGWGATGIWGVLLVNVMGAFALGWFLARRRGHADPSVLAAGFVAIGFLGSFTTFSAFSLEVVLMFENGAWLAASTYVVISLMFGIAAVLAGRQLAESR